MADVMDNGMNMSNFATKGIANAGLTTGIIGTALGVLGGGLNGILGNWGNNNSAVNDLMMENAILKAGKDVDAKLVDVYKELGSKTLDNERELSKFKADTAVALSQLNASIAVNSSSIGCIQNTLNSLTKVVIPSTNVCTSSSSGSSTT